MTPSNRDCDDQVPEHLMPSWQARVLSAYARLRIRRREWGDTRALTRRARRLFGAPPVYRQLVLLGLRRERVISRAKPPPIPRASPVYAELSGLPPLLLQVGSTELLLDDARRVRERVVAPGGSSRLTVYEDVMHGWHLLAPLLPEARVALREVATFVHTHLASPGKASAMRSVSRSGS